MVFFTCNACGQAIKKAQVEKHYQMQCRQCDVLSCIDCGKDFYGDDYKQHTQCISENEKYGGKGYKAPQKLNKGEAKQAQWLERVRESCSAGNVSSNIKNLLEKIAEYPNIPRKKAKFENFVRNSVKVHNPQIMEQIWNVFSSASAKEETQQASKEKPDKDSTATSPCPAQKTRSDETNDGQETKEMTDCDTNVQSSSEVDSPQKTKHKQKRKTNEESDLKTSDSEASSFASPRKSSVTGEIGDAVATDGTKKTKHKKEKTKEREESSSIISDTVQKVKKKKRKEKQEQNDIDKSICDSLDSTVSKTVEVKISGSNDAKTSTTPEKIEKNMKIKLKIKSPTLGQLSEGDNDGKKKVKKRKAGNERVQHSHAVGHGDVDNGSPPKKKQKKAHHTELGDNSPGASLQKDVKVSAMDDGKSQEEEVKVKKMKTAAVEASDESGSNAIKKNVKKKRQKGERKHSSESSSVCTPVLEGGQQNENQAKVMKKKIKKGVSAFDVSPKKVKDKGKKKKTSVTSVMEDTDKSGPKRKKKKKRKHDETVQDESTQQLLHAASDDLSETAKKKVKKTKKRLIDAGVSAKDADEIVVKCKTKKKSTKESRSQVQVKAKKIAKRDKSSQTNISVMNGEVFGEKQTAKGDGVESNVAVKKVSKKKKSKDPTSNLSQTEENGDATEVKKMEKNTSKPDTSEVSISEKGKGEKSSKKAKPKTKKRKKSSNGTVAKTSTMDSDDKKVCKVSNGDSVMKIAGSVDTSSNAGKTSPDKKGKKKVKAIKSSTIVDGIAVTSSVKKVKKVKVKKVKGNADIGSEDGSATSPDKKVKKKKKIKITEGMGAEDDKAGPEIKKKSMISSLNH